MKKIVILDGYTTNPGDLSWEWMNEYGEVTVYDRTSPDETVERCKNANIIVSNKTVLSKEILQQVTDLEFVELLSTGYNIVDHAYLKERGIPVCNIPSYSTMAVAQMTFALILEICNKVGRHSRLVSEGKWSECKDFCFWDSPLVELNGKTIGIIGFGKIGQAVADIADKFGMKVIAYAPRRSDQSNRKNFEWVELDELLSKADVVTLHCPLTAETEGMVNYDFISKMKTDSILINTSRGPVVDDRALANALNSNYLMGAGLDVITKEPPEADNPLLTAKNCFITPHISWAAFETRERLMSICKENFRQYFNSTPVNVVNK
ncbi:MAG: D-2-hydroxyacid dehydrogenase [Clostridiales bacterium]|nr:D-2-hydroxyacid dehydrogenase [Clostridiales bacterium]